MGLITPVETWREDSPECRFPPVISSFIRPGFDRLVLTGEDFVDNDKLDKIIKIAAENGLRAFETERTRVFRGRDLRCARLAGTDLSHSEFIEADLSGAALNAAHLEGSTFSGANLAWANLDGARLQGSWFGPYSMADGTAITAARMSRVRLRNAQMQDANLADIDFEEAILEGTQLATANLSNAKLSKATIAGVTLTGANLVKAQIKSVSVGAADLRGANLEGAELQFAVLDRAKLNGANFLNAHLEGASFRSAELQGANLSSAQLHGARLGNSKLMGAMLEFARLETADLSSADLRGAMVERVNLAGADLSDANLGGATFKDSTLSGASFSGASLELASFENARLQAVNLVNAKLPETFLGGTRLQGAQLAASELAGAILSKTFLWRAYLSSAQDCGRAHVSEPILESAWDYARYTRGGVGTALREIAPNIIDTFLRDGVEKASAEPLEQLRTRLNALLAPESEEELRANMTMWRQCADDTNVRSQQTQQQLKADYETRAAAYLLKLMCDEGADTKYLAEGLVAYRIKAGAPLAEAFARGFVGLGDKACPAAAQIDEKTKAAIRTYLPKKQAG